MRTVMLAHTAEHEDLRQSVRRFFESRCPPERLRELIATKTGYDDDMWQQMAGQLGLQSIAVPEEFGGAGYGLPELAIVLEEMGRLLVPSPFLGSALLAVTALTASGDDEVKADLLPAIADGSARLAVAYVAPEGDWAAPPAVNATEDGGTWVLVGAAGFVIDVQAVNTLLVFATTGDGETLFVVNPAAPGVTRRDLASLDPTRRLGHVSFEHTPARIVGTAGGARRAKSAVADAAAVGLAAELVGVGQRCLDLSVQYAKSRYQFGRAIASFQAIKHMAAEMTVTLELSRSLVDYAVVADLDEFPAAVSAAKSFAGVGVFGITADAIQIHGGFGFTEECDLHLYYKRAKSNQLMFGDETQQREALLARAAP